MFTRPVVSEISGGVVPPPQMLFHCQKEQMLLTVQLDFFEGVVSDSLPNTGGCKTETLRFVT